MRFERGSCVVCGQGTDTALACKGAAEAHVAFLEMLGVPEGQAESTVSFGTTSSRIYRVCARCVRESGRGFPPPVLLTDGAKIPEVGFGPLGDE